LTLWLRVGYKNPASRERGNKESIVLVFYQVLISPFRGMRVRASEASKNRFADKKAPPMRQVEGGSGRLAQHSL